MKRPASSAGNAEGNDKSFCQQFLQHCLARCARPALRKLSSELKARSLNLSSGCSGSGMAEAAHFLLMGALGAEAPASFACEKVKGKQAFIANVVQRATRSSHCIFDEMADLPSGVGICYVHTPSSRQPCTVGMDCDVFVCGFSCKDFSRLNASHSAEERRRVLEEGIGSTGSTFRALRAHVKRARPAVLFLENVDELTKQVDNEPNPNLTFLWESFADIGYYGIALTMKSNEYGLPQTRTRAVLIVLDGLYFNIHDGHPIFDTIRKTVESFKMAALPLASFLEPAGSQHVADELARKREGGSKEMRDVGWPEFHQNFLQRKGMTRMQVVPGEHIRSSEWFRLLSSREREALGYGLMYVSTRDWQATTIDISQRIDRLVYGKHGVVSTITPNNKTWLVELPDEQKDDNPKVECNRLLLGRECLALQGFPVAWVDGSHAEGTPANVTEHMMMDLAGNAFSFSIIVAAMLGTYLHLEWKPRHSSTTAPCRPSTTLEDIMALMHDD